MKSKMIASATIKALVVPFILFAAGAAFAIDPPTNPRAVIQSATQVQWEWDWTPGATKYEVTIDGAYAGSTPDTKFFSQNLWAGEHSMTVKAINDAGKYSESSATEQIIVKTNFNDTNSSAPPPIQNDNDQPIDPASYSYSEATQKPGYELTFSDEFNASNLNSSRWNTQLRWDGEFNGERNEYRVINGENQFYVNSLTDDQDHLDLVASQHNPFELDGSRLAIRAVRNPLKTNNNKQGHGPLREMVAQQDFLSGALTTYDKFTQKYGYFEARIKIPNHVGTFPAFWLHHQKRNDEGTHKTEIDIMENLGHAPWYIYNSFHYFNNVNAYYDGDAVSIKPRPEGQIYNGTDFSQDYHTYAVEWEPGKVTWLIDGEKVSEVQDGAVDYEDLYLIMNLAIGGHWTNYPENSGGLGRDYNDFFPTQNDLNNFTNPALEIDYVRVYKRK